MQRKASAVWKGGLKDGKGTISAPSGVLKDTQYSFSTRFENGQGTNPEELIAAAHAGCFSMALSAQLGSANLTAESISTTVTLSLDKLDSGWKSSGGGCGYVSEVCGGGGEGMSGVEGAEREDYDECEAGVEGLRCPRSSTWLQSGPPTTRETK
jgi:lipoyl-dependent peroxiredoxin